MPALVLGGWGGLLLWRHGARDALALSITGWTLACMIFLVIGVVTPVDMRYYLAVLPVVALAGGLAASTGWRAGVSLRVVTAALLAWAALNGVTTWWSIL
jgi:hypothetical protein